MYIGILLLLSILPSIWLGTIVYKNDRIEKEPLSLLIKNLFGGLGAVIMTLILTVLVTTFIPILKADTSTMSLGQLFLYLFICVGFIEEISKWTFTKKISFNDKNFNYTYDGIVYCVFVALGFATIENVLYVIEGGIDVSIIRAICSVPGHVFFAVFMGYYLGLAKKDLVNNNRKSYQTNILKSIMIPTILHTFFDFCLYSGQSLYVIIYFAYILSLYIIVFKKLSAEGKINGIIKIKRERFCESCGAKVKGNFCEVCGKKIKED